MYIAVASSSAAVSASSYTMSARRRSSCAWAMMVLAATNLSVWWWCPLLVFVNEHVPTAQAREEASTAVSSSNDLPLSTSLFVLCASDGSIYSVDAWTGEFRSKVLSGPPLISHQRRQPQQQQNGQAASASESASTSPSTTSSPPTTSSSPTTTMMIPGLDGTMYWHEDGDLQALPLTMEHILEHPVRSCEEEDEDQKNRKRSKCGILTATAHTSLIALDSNGRLAWKTVPEAQAQCTAPPPSRSDNDDSDDDDDLPTVILQRKDYFVQEVAERSGRQNWNATLATYQALEFNTEDEKDDDDDNEKDNTGSDGNGPSQPEGGDDDDILLLQDNNQNQNSNSRRRRRQRLPSIVFSHNGRTLSGVDPDSQFVLWQIETPVVVASLFGMHAGQWSPVDKLAPEDVMMPTYDEYHDDDDDDDDNDDDRDMRQPQVVPQRLLPSKPSSNDETSSSIMIDYYSRLWHRQQQQQPHHHYLDDPSSRRRLPAIAILGDDDDDNVKNTNNDNLGTPSPVVVVAGTASRPPLPLELPAPTLIMTQHQHQYQGLLISWRIVTFLLVSLILLAVSARVWYLRKRQQWTERAKLQVLTTSSSSGTANNSSSTSAAVGAALGSNNDEDYQSQQQRLQQKVTNTTAAESASPKPQQQSAADPLSQQQQQSPTAAEVDSQQGSFPLVRYSRYDSEFKELRAMGRGGFGTVFQCQNSLDGRDYAIKKVLIRGKQTSFAERLGRVVREVKILAVLDHPHIVRYYTAWLELEEENDEDDNDGAAGDFTETSCYDDDGETSNMSRRFSSSLLTEMSDWNLPSTKAQHLRQRNNHSLLSLNSRKGSSSHRNSPLLRYRTNSDSSVSIGDDVSYRPPPSYFRDNNNMSDCGFIFEDSKEDDQNTEDSLFSRSSNDNDHNTTTTTNNENYSGSIKNDQQSITRRHGDGNREMSTTKQQGPDDTNDGAASSATSSIPVPPDKTIRYMLYIQMQLCKQETISDFLSDPVARQGPGEKGSVDIPTALLLFSQISQAVHHVHTRGLIHRDLKPLNCFMDESGNVKVGDFGLSRESTEEKDDSFQSSLPPLSELHDGSDDNHTAGVGTRLYASPEQMSGSDYDSSTDVFSLGIILFELCYAMYTGMERNICLSKLRTNGDFPKDWNEKVGNQFPSLKPLVLSMIDKQPATRPTAEKVAQKIQSILGEFTIQSLDLKHVADTILLRVEAENQEDALQNTIQYIHDISSDERGKTDVVQYGLRSSDRGGKVTTVMEFALRSDLLGKTFVTSLEKRPEIIVARQVSNASQ